MPTRGYRYMETRPPTRHLKAGQPVRRVNVCRPSSVPGYWQATEQSQPQQQGVARQMFEKIFPADVMSKRERVEATLNHQPVDRAAILEQLSYNPRVIAQYTGKPIDRVPLHGRRHRRGSAPDNRPDHAARGPKGTDRVTTDDGFVIQNDNWQSWHASRPFSDPVGARDWLLGETRRVREAPFDAQAARAEYRRYMLDTQAKIGETVILNFSFTRFCEVFDKMGLELYTYFFVDYPEVLDDFMEAAVASRVAADSRGGRPGTFAGGADPGGFLLETRAIFSPTFCRRYHHEPVRRLAEAWHEHGIKALFHSDGNYKAALPGLLATGVDGFYCLEPNAGMDIVELKNTYPQVTWSGASMAWISWSAVRRRTFGPRSTIIFATRTLCRRAACSWPPRARSIRRSSPRTSAPWSRPLANWRNADFVHA